MAIHIHINSKDAGWNESDHPRAPDGKFGSGSSAKSLPEGFSRKPVQGMKLFRASESEELPVTSGGKSAIADGTYFGLAESDVSGYGGKVRGYKISGDVVEVNGDKDLDKLKDLAMKEAREEVDEHIAAAQSGKSKIDPGFIAARLSPSSSLSTYLIKRGVDAVHYKNKGKDDHHEQVVVLDPSKVERS